MCFAILMFQVLHVIMQTLDLIKHSLIFNILITTKTEEQKRFECYESNNRKRSNISIANLFSDEDTNLR